MRTMRTWRVAVGLVVVPLMFGALAAPVDAQGILGRTKKKVRTSAPAQEVNRLSTEAQLLGATFVDLEAAGLPVLAVGPLTFGVGGVEIKNQEGVRLHAYLYNPSASESAVIPAPGRELFVLVDERGRRMDLLGDVEVDDVPKGAAEITVPALERVELYLLYGAPQAGANTATLKVGEIGIIAGIPVHTAAAPAETRAPDVWTRPTDPR
jgi:hypothetical protein